ncbi:MAG: hypothetical protein AAFQ43_03745, partial [Bacteroidota bacterium]
FPAMISLKLGDEVVDFDDRLGDGGGYITGLPIQTTGMYTLVASSKEHLGRESIPYRIRAWTRR